MRVETPFGEVDWNQLAEAKSELMAMVIAFVFFLSMLVI
jgi:hypothetical protein